MAAYRQPQVGTCYGYERRHAKAAAKLLDSMGQSYDGTDVDRERMVANIPMVAFSEALRAD